MSAIVGDHDLEGGDDLLHGVEREQTLARRNEPAEARILSNDRLAGCQITGAALAEPAASQAYVLILSHCELAIRGENVIAVGQYIRGQGKRVDDPPAVRGEQPLGLLILQRESQLHSLPDPAGQINEFQEFVVFAPSVNFAIPLHIFILLPMRHGSKTQLTRPFLPGERILWRKP